MASVRCIDNVLGFQHGTAGFSKVGTGGDEIPADGNELRNLIEGADLVMSNILHFYHLAALDYININYTDCPISGHSPWAPKDNVNKMVGSTAATTGLATALILEYVAALNIRRRCHEMAALMSGKHPCQAALIPGGVTKTVDTALTGRLSSLLGTTSGPSGTSIRSFIHNVYIPTVVTVAKTFSGDLLAAASPRNGVGRGTGKFIAYGTFPDSSDNLYVTGGFLNATASTTASWTAYELNQANIKEHVTYSKYDAGAGNIYSQLHPSVGVTKPDATKSGAYSWLKAPRYHTGTGSANCHVCEVGPLARVLVNVVKNVAPWPASTSTLFSLLALPFNATTVPLLKSTIGRHGARALETMIIADAMTGWITNLNTTSTTGQTYRHRNIPRLSTTGFGLTEAPRGALGHWCRIDGKKISNYQCVVPTTWNASPKDDYHQMGPIESCLSGVTYTEDATGRTNVGRVVRAFDPCIACAVHVVSPDKKKVTKFMVTDPTR
jgi:hydrogenase large subunit